MDLKTLPGREKVPAYHYQSPQSRAILEESAQAALRAGAAADDLEAQLTLTTATWGIDLWERVVGIRPPAGQSLEDRRKAVRRKLTGSGNTTEAMIEEIGRTYTGMDTKVVVNDDYSFTLRLIADRPGIVTLDPTELYRVVEEIKPAHLRFYISQLRWSDLDAMGKPWSFFEQQPTTWDELESWMPVGPANETEAT